MYKGLLKITPAEAHVMCDRIKRLHLQRPEWFDLLTYEDLASCYNGAGSDDTPKPLRKVFTRILGFAQEAILIHDAEYTYIKRFCPGDYMDKEKFFAANQRLGDNAEFLANKRTPWYSPLRYYWRIFVARDAKIAVDEFGYSAWIE